jgi:hypothetical protein
MNCKSPVLLSFVAKEHFTQPSCVIIIYRNATAPLGSFGATQALTSLSSHSGDQVVESFKQYRASTPKLAPPAPSGMKETAMPNYSFKNVSRRKSEQDQTMENMLQELRKSRDMSQKASQKGSSGSVGKTVLPLRASMFMTEDGERDFSIVEETGNDSDSDVDVNDFRPKKGLGDMKPQRSKFNDSTNSLADEPVLEAVSVHAPTPQSFHSKFSQGPQVGEEDGPLKKVSGISIVHSGEPSVLDIAPQDAEEVDLQSVTT